MMQTREFFDHLAATWEKDSFPPETRERLAVLLQTIIIPNGAWVLDVGAGTGILHPYLLQAVGTQGRVMACDLSFRMLTQAHKNFPMPNRLCIQADVTQMPLSSAICDVIICFAAFPHIANKLGALREMARVAKQGAEIVIAHLMSRMEIMRHHDSHPAVAGDHLPEASHMKQIVTEAGFSDPTIRDAPGLYLARARRI